MAKIVLKQVKLVGNWQNNTQVDIRFISSPIGSPLTVPTTSTWVNYPANTSFNLPGPGNLWQYLNGAFLSMCPQPLDTDPTQTNVQAKISSGLGDAYVKYDIVP